MTLWVFASQLTCHFPFPTTFPCLSCNLSNHGHFSRCITFEARHGANALWVAPHPNSIEQSHSQFPSGIYNPLYMFVRPGDSSGFDVLISINGTGVDVNGPLLLHFHFQPPPGAYNSASTVKSVSALTHKHDSSTVDVFFLKGTMHSSFHSLRSNSFSFSSPKTTIDNSTTTFRAFACQLSHHYSFPMTIGQFLFGLSFL